MINDVPVGSELLAAYGSGYSSLYEPNTSLQGDLSSGDITTVGEYDKMLKQDAMVAAGWRAMISVLQGVMFDIGADERCNPRVKEYAYNTLFETPDKTFSQYAEQLWRAVKYGYVGHEILVKYIKGQLHLKDLCYRPPRTFSKWNTKSVGDGWVESVQWYYDAGSNLKEVPYGPPGGDKAWLLWSIFGDSSNLYGESILRPIWYIHKRKVDALKIMGIAIQRNTLGMPMIRVKDKYSPTKKDVEATRDEIALLMAHSQGCITLPDWADKIDWVFSGDNSIESALKAMEHFNIEILEAFSAQWLGLGLMGQGSRAVAETGSKESRNVRAYYLDWLSRSIQQLLNYLVVFNFGPQDYYPYLKCIQSEELTVVQLVESMVSLKNAGMLGHTPETEIYIRELMKLPEMEQVEAEQRQTQEKGKIDEKKEDEKKDDPEFCSHSFENIPAGIRKPPKPGGQDRRTGPNGRPLSRIEKMVGWDRIELSLDTSQQSLALLYMEIKRDVANYLVDKAVDAEWATAGQLASVIEKTKIPQGFINRAIKRVKKELTALADIAGDTAEREYERQTSTTTSFAAISFADIPGMSDFIDPTARKDVSKLVTDAHVQVVEMALEIMAPTRDGMKIILMDAAQELEQQGAIYLSSVVATKVFSRAREDRVKELTEEVNQTPTYGFYSAVLDANTCGACAATDAAYGDSGERIQWGGALHASLMPPNQGCLGGSRCRCILVWVWE